MIGEFHEDRSGGVCAERRSDKIVACSLKEARELPEQTRANPWLITEQLETKANAELSLERNSDWLRESGSAKEIDWLTEVRRVGCVLELVTEVASVENVEGFEEEAELLGLAKFEELRNAHVQL